MVVKTYFYGVVAKMNRFNWKKISFCILLLVFLPGNTAFAREFTLEDAYRQALKTSDGIKISELEIEKSRRDVTVASSGLLPQINLSGQSIRQKEMLNEKGEIVADKTNTVGRAEMRLHLYQGGKPWFERSSSVLGLQAVEADVFRTRQQVLFAVARAYYQVLLSQRNEEIANTVLQRAKNQLEQAEGLFEAGEVTRTAVLRARVQISQATEQLERSSNELKLARDNLVYELGISELPGELNEPAAVSFADTPVENYIEEAYRTRSDLKGLKAREKATAESVKAERASWFPQLNLVSSYETFEEKKYEENDDWQVMVEGSYPLFSGWRETAQMEKAEKEHQQDRTRRRDKEKSIRIEVREAYLNLQTRREIMNSLRQQVQSAQQNYEEISAQFEEALATSLDVSDAHQVLKEAELSLARSYYSYQLEILALKLATGSFQRELLEKETKNGTRS
ncbi:MAG: TolC family protein [bacterium]